MATKWKVEREGVLMEFKTAQEQRLHDLALCLVIPWPSGFPQCFWETAPMAQRLDEIQWATAREKLPWQSP
jgi:hypothetical protein